MVNKKFSHWFHDLGFKTCLALSLFTFGLTFSLIIPLLIPFLALFFTILYCFEKYHVLYTYSLSFDSSLPLRKSLIIYPLYTVLIFQTLMFSIFVSVLSRRYLAYLFGGLAIEILITVCAFEFMRRKPWEGREQKIEQFLEEQ